LTAIYRRFTETVLNGTFIERSFPQKVSGALNFLAPGWFFFLTERQLVRRLRPLPGWRFRNPAPTKRPARNVIRADKAA